MRKYRSELKDISDEGVQTYRVEWEAGHPIEFVRGDK